MVSAPANTLRAVGVQAVEGAGACQIFDLHLVELPRIDARGEIGEVARTAGRRAPPPAPASPPCRPSSPPPARSGSPACRPSAPRRVKSAPERLMSGGSTRDAEPRRPPGAARRACRCCSCARLMQAARNATGWLAFIQAVWYGDQRVGGGVRLVEAVIGELRHQVEHLDGLRLRRCRAPSRRSMKISRCASISDADLLAHRAAQQVGAAQAVAAPSSGRSASPVPGRP